MTPDELADLMLNTIRQAVAPLVTRIAVLETKAAEVEIIGMLRERLAVVEAREPIPGPPGPPGADGQPGADGLGFDHVTVKHDGRRTLTFACHSGDRSREMGDPVVLPIPVPEGRYAEGRTYEYGDLVTHDRSSWLCTKSTSTIPGTSAGVGYWLQLAARGERGRDAR